MCDEAQDLCQGRSYWMEGCDLYVLQWEKGVKFYVYLADYCYIFFIKIFIAQKTFVKTLQMR